MKCKRCQHDNPRWKGDNVGYQGLHKWLRTNLPVQRLCEECKVNPPHDVANITGIYSRAFENWKRLCRSCHEILDGNNRGKFTNMSAFVCCVCKSAKTYIRPGNGRPTWFRLNGLPLCSRCQRHMRYLDSQK